jgi:hypothetical protein
MAAKDNLTPDHVEAKTARSFQKCLFVVVNPVLSLVASSSMSHVNSAKGPGNLG